MLKREVAQHHVKSAINGLLRFAGVRLERHDWGPRGWRNTLERMRGAGFAPDVVLDVGAAHGTWTQECLRIFPSAHYHLFEPVQHASPHLARLAKAHSNVTLHAKAVGARDGMIALHANGDQSSVYTSGEHKGPAIQVPICRLDTALAVIQSNARVLLKADVQGYEIEVLKGAQGLLMMVEAVLLEVSMRRIYDDIPLAHDMISAMGERGYRIFDICTYSQRPLDRELAQADIMFVRSESRLFGDESWAGVR